MKSCIRRLILPALAGAILSNVQAFGQGWFDQLTPPWGPSVPSSASGNVFYEYEYIGDSLGYATCALVFGDLEGSVTEYGTVGATVVVDRAWKKASSFELMYGPCDPGGPSSSSSSQTKVWNGSSYVYSPDASGTAFNNLPWPSGIAWDDAVYSSSSTGCYTIESLVAPLYSDYYQYDTEVCWCGLSDHMFGWSGYYWVRVTVNQGCSGPSLPSNPGSASGSQKVKPTVTVTKINDANEYYGTDGKFRISRTGSTASSLSVSWSVGGTAIAYPNSGNDYIMTGMSGNTISAGNSYIDVLVDPVNDGVAESTETVILTMSSHANANGGSPSSATVNITD